MSKLSKTERQLVNYLRYRDRQLLGTKNGVIGPWLGEHFISPGVHKAKNRERDKVHRLEMREAHAD